MAEMLNCISAVTAGAFLAWLGLFIGWYEEYEYTATKMGCYRKYGKPFHTHPWGQEMIHERKTMTRFVLGVWVIGVLSVLGANLA